ncbi:MULTISPECIES: fumarylacetoacetate hydrolase family protein [unclassified Pseudofrankia]|uniref:fumarylacetoacetate hydrolase family protein n=1 Tax=unclassified Pseudofrankia TaxID=2994372 RepID=UPI0009F4E653|nr:MULTISPECIES: fumarylacetoacetate hydrolase family protein [unclassified Pseudofrankia]MDT3442168.1 fumarylacetoacetate hydrolase family protein [Pseudofrankia sp. BMG5.37]
MKATSFLDSRGSLRLAVADPAGAWRDVTAAALDDAGPQTGLSPMRHFLSSDGDWARLAIAAESAPVADIVTPLAPVPDPSKVVAAPVNYRDHQSEMNEDIAVDALGVFLKAPSSLIGDSGTVRLPYHDRRFDQEGELAVIIGQPASHVSEAGALNVIAGYTCLLDMTMRGGEDRSVRKSFDTFTPAGPYLVTADEVGDPAELELRTWVGGQLRQRADLADLIWSVPRLIAYISSVMQLQPGDLIATGTPAGVGEVCDGQDIAVEITRVGRLQVTVSSQGAFTCPTLGKDRGPVPPAHVTPPSERVRA